MPITIMTGAHQYNPNKITKYALTLGGLNTVHEALKGWDPLMANYPRIFMVRKPISLMTYFKSDPAKFNAFKHMIEYGNLGISGLGNITVEFDQIKGGYGGREFEIPKGTTNGTTELVIKVPELSGSPVREMVHTWVNQVVDIRSSLLHYGGLVASGELGYSQAMHTAEFIYVQTDRSGMKVEYAVHFTNCFPKEIPTDHFNGDDPSDHKHIDIDLKFTCCANDGFDVNMKATKLLKSRQIMVNSLEYCTGLDNDIIAEATGYNPITGLLESRASIDSRTLKSEDGKNDGYYRTPITSDNPADYEQGAPLDTSEEHYNWATPSFTDMGNKKRN